MRLTDPEVATTMILDDVPEPDDAAYEFAPSVVGTQFTPDQHMHFYTPDVWEGFVREWVTVWKSEYEQIKRIGGPGDRGIDVAAFRTKRGLEGAWDCFQAKHYGDALAPHDAWPEMLKILQAVLDGHCVLPDSYVFVAPRGCGTTLNTLISQPSECKAKFLSWLDGTAGSAKALPATRKASLKALAKGIDFSMFKAKQIEELLEEHRTTRYYSARFGTVLPPRQVPHKPPSKIDEPTEAVYVSQLVEVYKERWAGQINGTGDIHEVEEAERHFRRQRISFYRAESLRTYSRDSVPDGTFDRLQDDIYMGVVDLVDGADGPGWRKLSQVLVASGQLDLSKHHLLTVASLHDRHGICHQLANEERLRWIDPA